MIEIQVMQIRHRLKVQGESDGQKAYVSASNRETADYQLHSLMFYWNDEDEGWIDGATPYVNQEEAIQITDEKLKGVSRWKLEGEYGLV